MEKVAQYHSQQVVLIGSGFHQGKVGRIEYRQIAMNKDMTMNRVYGIIIEPGYDIVHVTEEEIDSVI